MFKFVVSAYTLILFYLLSAVGYAQFVSPIMRGANVVVTITSPTSASTYNAGTDSSIVVGVTAVSNSPITGCSWTNSLGGSGSLSGGASASGTVSLAEGDNVVTVTCTGRGNQSGSDVITITREASGGEATSLGAGYARGCTTPYYIDWDCDGYGPGVRSTGVYGWDVNGAGDMPDASDEDAGINTTASVISAYGSGGNLSNAQLKTFLSTERGYTADDVFYVSTSGNDGTGVKNNPALPFATWNGLRTGLGAGDVVVYRAGTYLNPTIGTAGPIMTGGSSGSPIIYMSYPGEDM